MNTIFSPVVNYLKRRAYAASWAQYHAAPYPHERLNWWQRHRRHHLFFRYYMRQAARLQELGFSL